MALLRAKARQEKLEKTLLDMSECKLDFGGQGVAESSTTEVLDKMFAAVTLLFLNVRDVISILNRSDPDVSFGPDAVPVKLGAGPGDDPGPEPRSVVEPGAERSPETQVEPETEVEPGTDGQKASDGIDK